MRIAYATTYDASDVHNWSGSGYYIAKALEKQFGALDYIGPLNNPIEFPLKVKKWVMLKILGKRYHLDRDPLVLKHYAAQVGRTLDKLKVDAVFSPGTAPLALLETEKPCFFWTDSTFAQMIDYYPNFSGLAEETIAAGRQMEQEVLSRCKLAFYSSEWAAQSAKEHYPEFKDKVRSVPFGANIEHNYSLKDIQKFIDQRAKRKWQFLFIGVEWYRKGADTAVGVVRELRQRGIDATLVVAGIEPPEPMPDFVKVQGFISKRSAEGRKAIDRLYRQSHFLLVPSRAENFGMVFPEANSYGLPAITRDAGGLGEVITNNVNGYAFPEDASTETYCDWIMKILQDPSRYRELSLSAYNEYATRLNWNVAGRTVKRLIAEVL